MSRINPEHVSKVLALVNQSPYLQLLNMEVQEISAGHSLVVVTLERKHLNAFGGIHGGAYASMVDTAAWWALYCDVEEDTGFTTLDLTVDNVRAADRGTITIEGRVIKRGRSICLTEAEARDEQGRLLVHCLSKQFLSPTLQPISAAVRELGSDPLPPKFLD